MLISKKPRRMCLMWEEKRRRNAKERWKSYTCVKKEHFSGVSNGYALFWLGLIVRTHGAGNTEGTDECSVRQVSYNGPGARNCPPGNMLDQGRTCGHVPSSDDVHDSLFRVRLVLVLAGCFFLLQVVELICYGSRQRISWQASTWKDPIFVQHTGVHSHIFLHIVCIWQD